ncbi:uncharacterized protein SOCE26_090960 [Sorangium cellulosum]|uniref:Uncharacterized protein n=1 Tax=Sorangium cellulosum TaxID=56 RepID=A0A2L0F7J5_SORCE|nr:uncharacterized protein SOCE26_090960 [Sorangium cellulosum]
MAVHQAGPEGAAAPSASLSRRCLRLMELPAGAMRWKLAAGCAGSQRAGGGALRVAEAYSWTAA